MDFRSELMAVPQDPLYETALRIWCGYYVETEMFDRAVCPDRSPRTGDAIPATAEQRLMCSRNARRAHEKAERQISTIGCQVETSLAAQVDASAMTLNAQQALIEVE